MNKSIIIILIILLFSQISAFITKEQLEILANIKKNPVKYSEYRAQVKKIQEKNGKKFHARKIQQENAKDKQNQPKSALNSIPTDTSQVNFVYPQDELRNITLDFIQSLSDIYCPILVGTFANRTDVVYNNHHLMVNWKDGTFLRDAFGKVVVGGFKLIGIQAISDACEFFSVYLHNHQCPMFNHTITVNKNDFSNGARPFVNQDAALFYSVQWLGFLGGLINPVFDTHASFEKGTYDFHKWERINGKLYLILLDAYDMEAVYPANATAKMYAAPTPAKTCEIMATVTENKLNKLDLFPTLSDLAGRNFANTNPNLH
jgi:hypothetical protein